MVLGCWKSNNFSANMKTHWEINILQCNYIWVNIYNYTFVNENKFLLLCTPTKQRYLWSTGISDKLIPALKISWVFCNPGASRAIPVAAPPWVSAGQMETPELWYSLIFLPAPSPERWERKKKPSLDKEVWGTEGLTAGGSWKGHQQNKKDKMQQNQKINRDGKCL